MKKVCIVGSSGYIGSKLSLELKKNFKVITVSRNKIIEKKLIKGVFKNIAGNIKSKKVIKKIVSLKPEYIIFASSFNHFKSEKNFKLTVNNNNNPLLNLC